MGTIRAGIMTQSHKTVPFCTGPILHASLPSSSPPAAQVVEEDPLVAAIHNHAEVFDPKAEFVFSYLQVRGVDSVKMMDCSLGAGWLGRSGP